jgi:hypothetical protein
LAASSTGARVVLRLLCLSPPCLPHEDRRVTVVEPRAERGRVLLRRPSRRRGLPPVATAPRGGPGHSSTMNRIQAVSARRGMKEVLARDLVAKRRHA